MKKFLALIPLALTWAIASGSEPVPEASLFVTSCHQIVAAILIMPDGTTKYYDGRSALSADQLKLLAQAGHKEPRVYEVGCYHDESAEDVPT